MAQWTLRVVVIASVLSAANGGRVMAMARSKTAQRVSVLARERDSAGGGTMIGNHVHDPGVSPAGGRGHDSERTIPAATLLPNLQQPDYDDTAGSSGASASETSSREENDAFLVDAEGAPMYFPSSSVIQQEQLGNERDRATDPQRGTVQLKDELTGLVWNGPPVTDSGKHKILRPDENEVDPT